MSEKAKEKTQKPIVPIIAEEEKQRILDVILSVGVFRWDAQDFVNLETGEKVKGKMWILCGSASLHSVQKDGIKVLKHYEGIDPKTRRKR